MSREIFSINLIRFREALEFDQYEMAKKLKVEQPSYRSWELGNVYPKMNTMIALCDFLQFKDLYKLVTEKIDTKEIKLHVNKHFIGELV